MALASIAKGPKWLFNKKSLKQTLPHLHRSKPLSPTPLSLPPPEASTNNKFRPVFQYLDNDGNGRISSDELQSYFTSIDVPMSSDEARRVVTEFDKDGDGSLEYAEFVKLMEGENEGEDDDIRRAFEMFEVEKGSGCITPKGLQQVLNRLRIENSGEDCKDMIRAFDLDGNGVLDFNEFNKMMSPAA